MLYVYFLHAGDMVPRYVGVTSNLRSRLNDHWRSSTRPRSMKDEWLDSLTEPPMIHAFYETKSRAEAETLESFIVTNASRFGLALTNVGKYMYQGGQRMNEMSANDRAASDLSLTTAEAAALLGVQRQNVCQLCRLGILRCATYGGTAFVSEASVQERLASNPKRGRPKSYSAEQAEEVVGMMSSGAQAKDVAVMVGMSVGTVRRIAALAGIQAP